MLILLLDYKSKLGKERQSYNNKFHLYLFFQGMNQQSQRLL